VLSGVATMELDGEVFTLSAGSGIAVKATQVHQLMNKNSENLRFWLFPSRTVMGIERVFKVRSVIALVYYFEGGRF